MSLLRQMVDERAWDENKHRALLDAALQVRRAGLEHLVTEASRAEVLAMAQAGEVLRSEQGIHAARALLNLPAALAPYDGGEALCGALLDATKAAVRAQEKH